MNQSTTFAQVATNLLNVLQGYTKGIRFVAVLTMLFMLGIGQAWGAEEVYSYTFSATQFSANGSKILSSVSWTLAGDGGYWGYDGTKGQQFGSSNAPYKTLTLSTSGISGTITKIIINTSGGSNVNASFTVSVGGTQWGNSTKLTTTATAYTFTGSNSGEIKFSYTQTSSKALYIKSISVTYETPDPYTVTLDAGPGTCAASVTEASAGAGVTLPEPTLDCGDWKFAGWAEAPVEKEISEAPKFITDKPYKPASNITLYAVYQITEKTEGVETTTITTDKLTRETTGVDDGSTTYSSWSGKTVTSSAVYAGNSAGSNNSIQLRSNNSNSGVITTDSGGKVTKITVVWNSNTADGRTLDIYGKKSAYSAATELYSTSTQGTKLGSIAKGNTTLTIEGDYEYIGLRSNSGAMYLTSISIDWATTTNGGASTTTYYHSTPECTTKTSVTLNPNGGTFTSTPDGWIKEGDNYTKEVEGSITLPTPIHDGCYDFAGWYDAQTGGNKIGDEYEPEEGIELFAHWTASAKSFVAMIDDENIPTVEGFAVEIGLNEDGTEKVTDGVATTCGNNVYLFRTLVQGYKEVQWTVTIDGTQETITVQNDGEVPYFVMPKANVWVSAELIECDEMDAPVVTATSTNNSITLSWNPITGAKEYNVFIFYDYGNSHQQDAAALVENETSYTFTNLDAEHTYTYIVQAQTEIGTCFTETMGEIATSSATCKVTYDANGGTGTAPTDTEYDNGTTVTVVGNYGALTKDGYAFTGWNTAADGSGTTYNAGGELVITANTTLYAQWCEAHWVLATDASKLKNDTRIIIAAKDYNVALSTKQNENNRGQETITKKYNTVKFGDDVQTLSLVGLPNNRFALYTGSGYLYAASSSANQLKTGGTNNGNGFWSIAINQGVARILAQGDKTHNQIKYNHQQSGQLFSCYESTNTTMSDVVIYKEVCKQDSYNVTSNLTNATAKTNPTIVDAGATSLTLNYSANTGNLLPETITVKMGGATLASGTDYTWNKETGVLTITVTGFYGDIDVKIVAEEDPCYQFAMSEVTATSTTPNSITLTWEAVEDATGYNVKLGTGNFTSATGLTHTFEGLSPNTTYNWEVQAVKDGLCEASKTGSTTTQKETFTVSWSVNDNVTSTESVVDGNYITEYPSDPSVPSGCKDKVFVGWTNQPIPTETNETPTLYTELKDIPAITANTPLYAVWADEKILEGQPLEVEETASVNISSYATANSWENDTKYESVIINSKITASASSNGTNTGKYFTNGNNWRFYQSDKGQLTITAADGCTIKTVKITYTVDKTGVLTYSGSNKESNSEITVNASSATFGVGNTASATNGQVRITDISVTYTTTTEGPDEITYSAYTTLCDNCTPSEALVLEASANTADLDINGKATITFSTTGGNGGAITYTANPKNGVSWENGVATFTKSGEYEITATQEKNGNYCPTVSNTLDVTITAIPYLYFTTEPADPIVFDLVECGGHTRLEDKKTVSVQGYNLEEAVTVTVTGDYKIARTSTAGLNDYATELTLDKNQEGHINGNYDDVYILSFPPAGSSEPTEGTLTFTTTNGNELTVSLSTPTITCTPCTLTFNDRGIKTTQEYYAGTEVPEPATPTGVCGEYEFDGWALAKVESASTTYEKVTFPLTMPANNQTVLYAVYRYTEGPTNQYELVTEIESGKDYVIAAYDEQNDNFALTNSESNTDGKFNSELVECDVNNIITTDNANIIWTVTGNDEEGYKFYNSAVKKYIEMYRSDGKSLLRLVDNCTNTFDVNIEIDENDKVYVDITSPEIDETYNVFSLHEQLFNVYKSCNYNIYFYEQTATPLYTTNPDCHPSVTLTSDGEVYVTATNGRGIMAATPLMLTTTDLAPNTKIAISSNSDDIYFSTERNTNFAMAVANQPQKSLPLTTNEGGELETPLYIHYKPSADGDGTPAEVVVTADVSTHNPPFTAQKTIHVRNLPAKFVIATKAGATWYALPANMNGATNPAAVVIEVDETTMTATAPNTTPYTLWPVATINSVETDRYKEYGERLRFAAVNNGNKGLWANNSKEGTDINNYAAITAANSTAGAAYEWKVTTAVMNGQWQYTLYSDQTNNQNHLCYSMNQENPAWGTYASNEAKYQLYFLPIKAETTPFDYQVVEWYPNKVLIQTSTTFSSLTAKIAGEEVDDVTFERKDANQYEVTGLPLMENPAKALTLEFVVADATHTGIHTIPVMLSGGNHSVSTLAIGKGIYNYTDLVVRDNATLTIDGSANTDNTFYDVTIYPTAKISVPEGKQLSVHRMTFIGGITEVYDGSNYTLNKYAVPELSLKGNLGKTVTTMDYVMRVDLDQMYSLALPYDVALDDITYGDGSAIELGSQLYVSAYDGAARAENLGANKNWVYETDFEKKFGSATLKAGIGYTISAEPQVQNDKYAILRLPMKSNISSGETEAAKSVAVTAHGAGAAIADNHKGWNLVANPYMASISGDSDEYSELMLRYMEMLPGGTWQWTGEEQRYVTIPYNDGSGYYQLKFSEAVLQPFKNFFVQVGTTGNLDFVLAHRQNAPARYMQTNTEREVEFEIILGNSLHQDNAGMLISDKYTPAYEINADLEKMTGSMSLYTIYNGYKLAYNATSLNEAEEWIPVGYIVPKVGEYTFKLDERAAVEDIIHIYLMDNETGVITDLIDNTYTFETSVKKNENRFVISVVLSQEESGTTTGVDDLLQQDKQAQKFIYNDQLFILRDGVVYDAMGQRITTINK